MKNIFVIPTDQPSRLSILNSGKLNFGAEIMSSYNSKPQNIYITSDEEIKDFWVLNTHTNEVYFLKGFYGIQSITKKIILTTDPKLIADGVQAIEDEFLEWFVNNSSCEEVEVDKWSSLAECGYSYHIIIPSEEPNYNMKQEIIDEMERLKEVPKQTSIEEAAERYTEFWLQNKGLLIVDAFEAGAKWQQEQDKNKYSEEDMKMSFEAGHKKGFSGYPNTENWKELSFKEWFGNNKKK